MGAFPNAAQCLLCSESSNSLISLCCSGDTPVAMTFPEILTSMSLGYLPAVLGFFKNARCITVGGSSPASVRVSAPPDLKEFMLNAVPSPALRACTLSAFVIYGADKGAFLLMSVPMFGRWEIFGKGYPSVMFQLSADCSCGARGHTLRAVFYGHGMIGAVSHQLSPSEMKEEAAFIWWP